MMCISWHAMDYVSGYTPLLQTCHVNIYVVYVKSNRVGALYACCDIIFVLTMIYLMSLGIGERFGISISEIHFHRVGAVGNIIG